MRTGNVSYLLKEGLRNIYANKMMSAASIGVLIACLLLIGSSVLVSMNINAFVGFIESQNEVVVFMDDDFDDDARTEFETELEKLPNIASIDFIDKEQGLREWVDGLGEVREGLFDLLAKDNTMPDSYRLQVESLENFEPTLAAISKLPYVFSVSAPMEVAETVIAVRNVVTYAGMAVIGILAAVASVIVANTIRLTVYSRRKEINIMKYVGATDFFIRMPFIVEGFMLGLISALFAFFLLWIGYGAVASGLAENPTGWLGMLAENVIPFKEVAGRVLFGFMGAGVLIGMLGSNMFLRKYLRV